MLEAKLGKAGVVTFNSAASTPRSLSTDNAAIEQAISGFGSGAQRTWLSNGLLKAEARRPQRKPKGMYSSVLQLHKSYAQDEAAVAEFVNEVKSSEGRTPEQACCTAPAPSSCSVS